MEERAASPASSPIGQPPSEEQPLEAATHDEPESAEKKAADSEQQAGEEA